MVTLKQKIFKKIENKEKQLKDFKKEWERKKEEEDNKFEKQLDEDFKFLNSINPFYKPKAFKMDNSFSLLITEAFIEGKLESEIKELKSLLN